MFGGEIPYSWCSWRASGWLSRYIHLWLLQWSARDNSLVEDSQEQRGGIAGMEVDWSPEWQ